MLFFAQASDSLVQVRGSSPGATRVTATKCSQQDRPCEPAPDATQVPVLPSGLFRLSLPCGDRHYFVVSLLGKGSERRELWVVPCGESAYAAASLRTSLAGFVERQGKVRPSAPPAVPSTSSAPPPVRGQLGNGAVEGTVVTLALNSSVGPLVHGETPTGSADGTNAVFSLAVAPIPETVAITRNGLRMAQDVDYTLTGNQIRFVPEAIPQVGDILLADYWTSPPGAVAAHGLLGPTHSDTALSSASRGGLIIGQGVSPVWARLPLGAANQCLVSNGTDAVWNTCLITGFTSGTIPFTGANGTLDQDPALLWNKANRKMAIGSGIGTRATLYVYDDRASGAVTELLVRSGSAQGAAPIQQWMASQGDAVAWVNADGGFNVRRLLTNSTSTRAAISDTGTTTDPGATALGNGDIWFNRTTATWKSREAGQTHAFPQVICSASGSSTTSGGTLGTCSIPAGLLLAGDRLRVEAQFSRTLGSGTFTVEIRLGSTSMMTALQQSTDSGGGMTVSLSVSTTQATWFWQAIRTSAVAGGTGNTGFNPGTAVQLAFLATAVGSASTVQLDNFTVTRFPAQNNP